MLKLAQTLLVVTIALLSAPPAEAESKRVRPKPKEPVLSSEEPTSILKTEGRSYDGGLARPLKIVRARAREGVPFAQQKPTLRLVVPQIWEKTDVPAYVAEGNTYSLRPLARCTTSETGREEVRHSSIFSEMLDMLFFNPSDAWQQQSVARAPSYHVPYVGGANVDAEDPNFNVWSLFAAVAEVECLPTRYRIYTDENGARWIERRTGTLAFQETSEDVALQKYRAEKRLKDKQSREKQ
ncbi:MAG: hypothetical protein IT290_09825 [Deltaproteobacteria bacterium]|nr:hypothetical protein [Deltaproteobacteria bacterium]